MEEENLDQLLEGIEEPAPEIPMTSDTPAAEPEPEKPAELQWNGQEWEFETGGKKIFPDSRDKARTWMSQGYNYSQRMAELNAQKQAIQTQRSEFEQKYKGYDRYAEIDKYAKQDPSWWQHVEKAWTDRGQQQNAQPAPEIQAQLKPFLEKLEAQEKFLEQIRQEKELQEQQRQDEALSADIKSIRDQHPTIDFDAMDESGKTLEARIVEHGVTIGTSSFRAAFRDLLFDQLQESAKAQKLAAEVKDQKAQKVSGIIGTTPTPRKGPNAPVQVQGRSWDDVARMAAEELGVSN